MNKALKAKWITALRSGDYNQTKGCLKDDEGYCCLGVLQAVDPVLKEDEESYVIDREQAADLGLTIEMQEKLAVMNDRGDSFKEIAAYIKRYI